MPEESESSYYSPLGFLQGKRPRIIPVGYAGYVPGMQETFGTPWKVLACALLLYTSLSIQLHTCLSIQLKLAMFHFLTGLLRKHYLEIFQIAKAI
jgi:hypothetical protein